MIKVKFYRENDYGAPSPTPINDPFEYGLYPFGQFVVEYTVDEITISRSMTETFHFNFTIPIEQINGEFPLFPNKFLICVVEIDGEYIQDGFVSQYTKTEDGVDVDCEDLILLVSYNRSVPHALFVDQQLISVVYKIINNYDYRDNHGNIHLRLGDFYTLNDPLLIVDSDLRECEQAYEQVNKFIEEQPNVYIRSGLTKLLHNEPDQIEGWTRTWDIGVFNKSLNYTYDESNILEISIEKQNEVPLTHIEPYGEQYTDSMGDTQILQISDIVNHPDYPTIIDVVNYPVEVNPADPEYGVTALSATLLPPTATLPNKRKAKIGYYSVRPKTTDNPSATQLGKAAYTLYRAVIKEFEANINDETEITLKSEQFPSVIMPGNIIKVNYLFRQTSYTQFLNKMTINELEEFSVVGNYYVVSYTIKYSNSQSEINLVLNRSGKYKSKEPEKQRKNLLNKQIKKEKDFFVELTPTDAWALHEINVSSVTSNSTANDGFDAYEFTVDTTTGDFGDLDGAYLPTVAVTPVNNYFVNSNRDPDFYFETDLLTTNTYGDTFTMRIHPKDRDWTSSESASIKILIKYEN